MTTELAGTDTLIAECAICYSQQPCFDDGEAYICLNRDACRARCDAAVDGTKSCPNCGGTDIDHEFRPPRCRFCDPIDGDIIRPYNRRVAIATIQLMPSVPPLSPLGALKFALSHGVFSLDTKAKLVAALDAAEQAEVDRAEQLAYAREQVEINLEMRQIEAQVFDLPF